MTTGPAAPAFRDVTAEAGLDGIDQAQCTCSATSTAMATATSSSSDTLPLAGSMLTEATARSRTPTSGSGLDFVTPATAATSSTTMATAAPTFTWVTTATRSSLAQDPLLRDQRRAQPPLSQCGWPSVRRRDPRISDRRHRLALAVTASDYDGDGDVDLGVANDFGRKVLYRNNGDGTFTDVTKTAGVLDFSGGMGLAFADLNFDGIDRTSIPATSTATSGGSAKRSPSGSTAGT